MANGEAVQVGAVPNKALHVTLWGVQALLALAFFGAGFSHATQPIDELAKQMGWPGSAPQALVRFIGIAELAGALGLLLPSITRIKPKLTVWAALGFLAIMVLAVPTHLARGEFYMLPVNGVLGGLAAFIAWGRSKKAPITARS